MVLPKMRETATKFIFTARLSIIVSSEVHAQTDLPERKNASIFEALNDRDTADMGGRCILRLFLSAFVAELSQKLEKISPGIMWWQTYDGVLQTNESLSC